MKVILRNSNRTQVLLTEAMLRQIPALGSQDGKGDEAIVHMKWFAPPNGWRWYITEVDPATLQAFGKVFSPFEPDGEWGYFDLREIAGQRLPPFGTGVERDLHFSPKPIKDINPAQGN